MFRDADFRKKHKLAAINSINWARILAQMVYYFYSYFRVSSDVGAGTRIAYSVPTGNFGDILAGYYARKLGLPIARLICAVNRNDILDRFFGTGVYRQRLCVPTVAPAMDIQVSSNFERLIHDLAGGSGEAVKRFMAEFEDTGTVDLNVKLPFARAPIAELAREAFVSYRVDEPAILRTINRYFFHHHLEALGAGGNNRAAQASPAQGGKQALVLDPHTAIGVAAAETHLSRLSIEGLDDSQLQLIDSDAVNINSSGNAKSNTNAGFNGLAVVCLATAHPYKFPGVMLQALGLGVVQRVAKTASALCPTRLSTLQNGRDYGSAANANGGTSANGGATIATSVWQWVGRLASLLLSPFFVLPSTAPSILNTALSPSTSSSIPPNLVYRLDAFYERLGLLPAGLQGLIGRERRVETVPAALPEVKQCVERIGQTRVEQEHRETGTTKVENAGESADSLLTSRL